MKPRTYLCPKCGLALKSSVEPHASHDVDILHCETDYCHEIYGKGRTFTKAYRNLMDKFGLLKEVP